MSKDTAAALTLMFSVACLCLGWILPPVAPNPFGRLVFLFLLPWPCPQTHPSIRRGRVVQAVSSYVRWHASVHARSFVRSFVCRIRRRWCGRVVDSSGSVLDRSRRHVSPSHPRAVEARRFPACSRPHGAPSRPIEASRDVVPRRGSLRLRFHHGFVSCPTTCGLERGWDHTWMANNHVQRFLSLRVGNTATMRTNEPGSNTQTVHNRRTTPCRTRTRASLHPRSSAGRRRNPSPWTQPKP